MKKPNHVDWACIIWLPGVNDFRRLHPIISIGYKCSKARKSAPKKKAVVNLPQKHIIHKAILWQKMIDDGVVKSLNEIANKEGLTRARVTQIMNLLKLPTEMQDFLAGLDDTKEICRYSERRLRKVDGEVTFAVDSKRPIECKI